MNRYQHQHPPTSHNSNTTFPSNHHHHFHLSSSTTTTTTTVLQTPIETYSTNNNSTLDLHPTNHYNLLDDNYLYNSPSSYCTKHHPIYRSPPVCTLDSQPTVYETYNTSTNNNIPLNTYEQLCIENSQTSPSSSWVTTASENSSLYHPIQSFDQCNIYLNNSQLSESNYRDYSSIPLSNNETSSSSTSSTSSFHNPPPPPPLPPPLVSAQYRHPEQSSISTLEEKPLAIVANEAKYKWMQIKRTPAKTAGKISSCFRTYARKFLSRSFWSNLD